MTVDKDTTRVKHIKLYNLLYGLQSHPTIHAASELRTLFFFLVFVIVVVVEKSKTGNKWTLKNDTKTK